MPRHRSKIPTEMPPAVKERLRKAYVEDDVPVRDLEARFGMGNKAIAATAAREGWPMRKKSREQRVAT